MFPVPSPSPNPPRAAPWPELALIAANLLAVCLAAFVLLQSLHERRLQAEAMTRDLAAGLADRIAGLGARIDGTLLAVADEVGRQLAAGDIDARALDGLLARRLAGLPELASLRVADLRGALRYGAGAESAAAIDLSDRSYFVRAREQADAGLIFDKPMFARLSRKWVIVLARRLQGPGGAFAGVVYANLELDYFARLFTGLAVGRNGSVALRDDGLGLVVRFPAGGGEVAIGSRPPAAFEQAVRSGAGSATVVARNSADGIERILSCRPVAGLPLYVVVGVDTDDYLSEWRREAFRIGLPLLLLVLASALWLSRCASKRRALL